MKEFYLVPIKEFNNLQNKCVENKPQEENILRMDKSIAPELILDMVQNIKNLNPIENKAKVKIEEGDENEKYLQFIPLELQTQSKLLLDKLLSLENISIDKYGIISVKGSEDKIRIEDILKAFLIKNARVRDIKNLIEKFINNIPNELIYNNRVKILKQGNNTSRDVFYDTIGGSRSNIMKPFTWIYLKCEI